MQLAVAHSNCSTKNGCAALTHVAENVQKVISSVTGTLGFFSINQQ